MSKGRNTQLTKGLLREVEAGGSLPQDRLDVVRDLAAEGVRPILLRRALGLSAPLWNRLMKADDEGNPSPLAEAIEAGIAQGASEVVAVMRANMRAGDTRAAAWLGERVYKIGADEGPTDAPRVAIFINAALTPEEYSKLVSIPAPFA